MGIASAQRVARQRGVVLIAVLWIVAALSIMVVGLSQAMRSEVRLASISRQSAVFGAIGDAAIHLVLQSLVASTERPARLSEVDAAYQGHLMRVQILPLNGLIDINNAPQPLLAALYIRAGGVAPQVASELALATIEARSRRDERGRPQGFEAIEDLLRVPGLDYSLYANIASLITADQKGSGRVNPLAAPEKVLVVLAGGNVERAARIAADRDSGGVGIDTTALDAEFIDSGTTRRFHLQARVPLPDGAWMFVSRIVDLGNDPLTGLPWRTLHADYRLESVSGRGN